MAKVHKHLYVTASLLAATAWAVPAFAQVNTVSSSAGDEAEQSEEIVVTGSSIRGVAPVGANLIQVGPQDIAETGGQTLSQVLQTVPALTSMGTAGQGKTAGSG